MNRYDGKPFLRLLECYFLKIIGQLPTDQESVLQKMEPKLREIYGVDGTWWAIVAAQMEFPDHLQEQLVGLWGRYGDHARLQGHEPDGRAFIVEFTEQNFPDVIR